MNRLASTIATFVQLPAGSTPHTKGVRYFRACTGIDMLWGAMDTFKEGQARKKRIIVRPSRFRDGLFELYTYHFPKKWSEACVANRELIKEAQRRAHALEKDHSLAALEWRLRFFKHYYRVFKGGAQPEPGFKPYSRFYQYTYVAIYRELKKAAEEAQKTSEITPEDISFEPVIDRFPMRRHKTLKPSTIYINIPYNNDQYLFSPRQSLPDESDKGDRTTEFRTLHDDMSQNRHRMGLFGTRANGPSNGDDWRYDGVRRPFCQDQRSCFRSTGD